MDGAVVELDALADTDGAGAQDQDLLPTIPGLPMESTGASPGRMSAIGAFFCMNRFRTANHFRIANRFRTAELEII